MSRRMTFAVRRIGPGEAGAFILIAALVLQALTLSCGCTLVDRAGTLLHVAKEAPAVPAAPAPTPERLELRSELADFVARGVARFWAYERDALKQQLSLAAQAVSMDVGPPVRPLPLPAPTAPGAPEQTAPDAPAAPDAPDAPAAAVSDAIAAFEEERAAAAREQYAWEQKVAEAAREPATRGWSISSPALGWYLLFGIGGFGAACIAVGRWVWKQRALAKAALEIIPGVQAFLNTSPAGAQLQLALQGSTSNATQVTISKTKATPAVQVATAQVQKVIMRAAEPVATTAADADQEPALP